MPEALDYTDPCAVLEALRPAYYALLRGSQAQIVEYDAGNGARRSVTYHRTDLSMLRQEITRLEIACAAKSSKMRRFGLRSGGAI